MGLRITTWNVNGIRNPFGYQPWREKRNYAAMFDILGADIVVFQETKIQRKDLTDDMVLVPGWDCFFSLPRHKKGYSGVAVYTRKSSCIPIRAEEGITGALSPLGSSTPYLSLDCTKQIGGYPTPDQLASSSIDTAALDAEGRAVILEFPAFVLIGVYVPANSDGSRNEYRQSFINMLDVRVRNLVSMGKRIVLTGDLNISREEIDVANAEASMRKNGLGGEEYASTPARRVLNQLLEGGKVFGKPDAGRERPVLYDICRALHPRRQGMFTCWEQKVNARPANCGARIDYVLCSLDMKDWIAEANIQEGLMGSDHCPVYAVFKDTFKHEKQEFYLKDQMNPPGVIVQGVREREFSRNIDALPLSARLIPEFSGRRNIKEMFGLKPRSQSVSLELQPGSTSEIPRSKESSCTANTQETSATCSQANVASGKFKARRREDAASPAKRAKLSSQESKGQSNLTAFFAHGSGRASKLPQNGVSKALDQIGSPQDAVDDSSHHDIHESSIPQDHALQKSSSAILPNDSLHVPSQSPTAALPLPFETYDPIQSKDSWSKLFTKPISPRCEGHREPCVSLLTKKPGVNLGRSFWMCPRPLGPSGAKEKNTEWRCQTFIWCSDWNARASSA